MAMAMRNDGLEDYTLGMDYGDNKAGDTIPVDPERKVWLDTNGYGVREAAPVPLPDFLPRHKRAEMISRAALPEIPSPFREEE